MPRPEHPPKKKHPVKPRPIILALTRDQQRDKARKRFEKALIHLDEAEAMVSAPNARAHSAYYAMHHAACAAILMAGGIGKYRDVPASHEHVIEHYGKLVAAETGFLGASGRALNRARTERVVADYDLERNVSDSEAKDSVREARSMIEAVSSRWSVAEQGSHDI